MKSKITILFILFISTVSLAQSKVGTVDTDYVISLMPERQALVIRSQNYGAKLDSTFAIKVNEYQEKLALFQNLAESSNDSIKKVKYEELAEMDQNIKKYKENGNKLMQLKQNELMRPLYQKLSNTIQEIAKEKAYTQILTITGNEFAYIDESFDITQLVMDKLGIKEPVESPKN
jgi:outer membrane protein